MGKELNRSSRDRKDYFHPVSIVSAKNRQDHRKKIQKTDNIIESLYDEQKDIRKSIQ